MSGISKARKFFRRGPSSLFHRGEGPEIPGKVFGVLPSAKHLDNGVDFATQTLSWLKFSGAFREEGVFRIAGAVSEVARLRSVVDKYALECSQEKDKLNEGDPPHGPKPPNTASVSDNIDADYVTLFTENKAEINDVASLLKMYYRELPSPLMVMTDRSSKQGTDDNNQIEVEAEKERIRILWKNLGEKNEIQKKMNENENENERNKDYISDELLSDYVRVFSQLCVISRKFLYSLFQFLFEMAENNEKTKMSVENLAIIFTPLLFFDNKLGTETGTGTGMITTGNDMNLGDFGAHLSVAQICIQFFERIYSHPEFGIVFAEPEPQSVINDDIKKKKLVGEDKKNSEKVLDPMNIDKKEDAVIGKIETKTGTPADQGIASHISERIVSVVIHKTDALRVTNSAVRHPVVRIHFVDKDSGEYLLKSKYSTDQKIRSNSLKVTSEKSKSLKDYLLPVISQPYNFSMGVREYMAKWEEEMTFRVSYDDFVSPNSNVLMLLELLDFGPSQFVNKKKRHKSGVGAFSGIAWGFLNLVGTKNVVHTEKQVRLQLFQYPKFCLIQSHTFLEVPEVYSAWKFKRRVLYPSTLYVTVQPQVLHVENLIPMHRPMTDLHSQKVEKPFSKLVRDSKLDIAVNPSDDAVMKDDDQEEQEDNDGDSKLKNKTEISLWSRMGNEPCILPRRMAYKLESGTNGCFRLCFSHSGDYLAAGCGDAYMFPVIIYDMRNGKGILKFVGHHDTIYDISWSHDDKDVVTCSSDGTVKCWGISDALEEYSAPSSSGSEGFSKELGENLILQHPCFVYCARWIPNADGIIVTAAFDGLIRFWKYSTGELLGQFVGHETHINALVLDSEGYKIYTGDGSGIVKAWAIEIKDKVKCECIKTMNNFNSQAIHSLSLHPIGTRLLIQGKGVLYIIDLRFYGIIHHLLGLTTADYPIRSTFSPDGKYIISGSESQKAFVWNDQGKLIRSYELGFGGGVCDVCWHPWEHYVGFCSFGSKQPIKIAQGNSQDRLGDPLNGDESASITNIDLESEEIKTMALERDKERWEKMMKMIEEEDPSPTTNEQKKSRGIGEKSSSAENASMRQALGAFASSGPKRRNPRLPPLGSKGAAGKNSLLGDSAGKESSMWSLVRKELRSGRFIDGTPEEARRRIERRLRQKRREKALSETLRNAVLNKKSGSSESISPSSTLASAAVNAMRLKEDDDSVDDKTLRRKLKEEENDTTTMRTQRLAARRQRREELLNEKITGVKSVQ